MSLSWTRPVDTQSTIDGLYSITGTSRPTELDRAEIDVAYWWTPCFLVTREPQGLFLFSVCGKVQKYRILTASQTAAIYNPSRFAATSTTFFFVLDTNRHRYLWRVKLPGSP